MMNKASSQADRSKLLMLRTEMIIDPANIFTLSLLGRVRVLNRADMSSSSDSMRRNSCAVMTRL